MSLSSLLNPTLASRGFRPEAWHSSVKVPHLYHYFKRTGKSLGCLKPDLWAELCCQQCKVEALLKDELLVPTSVCSVSVCFMIMLLSHKFVECLLWETSCDGLQHFPHFGCQSALQVWTWSLEGNFHAFPLNPQYLERKYAQQAWLAVKFPALLNLNLPYG